MITQKIQNFQKKFKFFSKKNKFFKKIKNFKKIQNFQKISKNINCIFLGNGKRQRETEDNLGSNALKMITHMNKNSENFPKHKFALILETITGREKRTQILDHMH